MSELLPIGSVVLLKGGGKRLMVFGVMQRNPEDNKLYDYIGCLYPEGFAGAEHNYLFNKEDIQQVEFAGLADEEHNQFRTRLAAFFEERDGYV